MSTGHTTLVQRTPLPPSSMNVFGMTANARIYLRMASDTPLQGVLVQLKPKLATKTAPRESRDLSLQYYLYDTA